MALPNILKLASNQCSEEWEPVISITMQEVTLFLVCLFILVDGRGIVFYDSFQIKISPL
jgi:hypothetical protein